MDPSRELLRHFLATIAYRTNKAVDGTSSEFGSYRAAPGVRTPKQIVRHMSDVLGYAGTIFTGGKSRAHSMASWDQEVQRFYEVLTELSGKVENESLKEFNYARLLQGPLADTMSHVGQLSMLRRMSGDPIAPENFIVADIEPGRTGSDQAAPVSPDEEWFDAEEEPY